MRKQYHFWPAEDGDGFDTAYWFAAGAQIPTVRRVVEHARLILEADRSYPILLGHEGRVMDGMHRVARALLEGKADIDAILFPSPLEPDHRGCHSQDLTQ